MAQAEAPNYNQQRLNLEAMREVRRRLEQHAKVIGHADGTDREALRKWIQGVNHAILLTNANDQMVMEIVGYLTAGSLARVITQFMQDHPNNVTWNGVRDAITTTFLDEDEREYLRNKVRSIKQAPYQDSREYGERYRDALRKAYTQVELATPLIIEGLIK